MKSAIRHIPSKIPAVKSRKSARPRPGLDAVPAELSCWWESLIGGVPDSNRSGYRDLFRGWRRK